MEKINKNKASWFKIELVKPRNKVIEKLADITPAGLKELIKLSEEFEK